MSRNAIAQVERVPSSFRSRPDLRSVAICLAVVLAVACARHLWIVRGSQRSSESIAGEYLLAASLSTLVVGLLYRFPGTLAISRVHAWWLNMSVACGLALSIWLLGMRQFGGYDHSAMIQAGWLQLSALRPFKDYPLTLPPLFFLGNRYAFLLFGVRWLSFVLLMAAFAVLSFFFLCRQLRALGFSELSATVLASTVELGTSVVCSYWWYNPITSVIGVMTFLSALVCMVSEDKWVSWILLALSFTFLLLSKPNAWPVGLCVLLVGIGRPISLQLRVLVAILLGSAVSGLVCWLHGLNPIAMLRTYAAIAETRGHPLTMTGLVELQPVELTILRRAVAIALLLFVAVLFDHRNELLTYWREYLCCVVAAATALVMAGMNYEIKTSDGMLAMIALAVAAFRPWSRRRFEGLGRNATVAVTVFFVVLSGYWSVTRLRVRGIGAFYENVPTATIQTGFFVGLHTGPQLAEVLREVGDAIHKYPSDNVFFGPRMEFAYAAFRRQPPRGLPVWWHPGSSFSVDDMAGVLNALDNDNFNVMIFLKGDRTRMPILPLQRKLTSYEQVAGFKELDVFVRKTRHKSSADGAHETI